MSIDAGTTTTTTRPTSPRAADGPAASSGKGPEKPRTQAPRDQATADLGRSAKPGDVGARTAADAAAIMLASSRRTLDRATAPARSEAREARREVAQARAEARAAVAAARVDGERKVEAKLEGPGGAGRRMRAALAEQVRQSARREVVETTEALKVGGELLEGAGEIAVRNPLLVHLAESARDVGRHTVEAGRTLRSEAREARREVGEARAQADRRIEETRAEGRRAVEARLEADTSPGARMRGALVEQAKQNVREELVSAREALNVGREMAEGLAEMMFRSQASVGRTVVDDAEAAASRSAEAGVELARATQQGAATVGDTVEDWGKDRLRDTAKAAADAGNVLGDARADVEAATREQKAESRREVAAARAEAIREIQAARQQGRDAVEAALDSDASPGARIRHALQGQATHYLNQEFVEAREAVNVARELGEGAVEEIATEFRNAGTMVAGGAEATGRFFGGIFGS